jgi:hypothetical protein
MKAKHSKAYDWITTIKAKGYVSRIIVFLIGKQDSERGIHIFRIRKGEAKVAGTLVTSTAGR